MNIWENKKVLNFLIGIFFVVFLGICFLVLKSQNNVANIVAITDKNYVFITKTALFSAIENKKKNSIYNINVICVDLDKNDENQFKELETKNVNINTINMSLKNLKIKDDEEKEIFVNHVTRSDLFKFFLPELFSKTDKILYLDSDVIVKKDLLKLYNTNISKYYLAAVREENYDSAYFENMLFHKDNIDPIKFPYYQYNCGVLLLNLEKMRKDNVTSKLIKQANSVKDIQTQLVFNKIIPLSTVKVLPSKYNIKYRYVIEKTDIKKSFLKNISDRITKLFNKFYLGYQGWNAVIIHYSGWEKPWFKEYKAGYVTYWRKYALKLNPNWKPEKNTQSLERVYKLMNKEKLKLIHF